MPDAHIIQLESEDGWEVKVEGSDDVLSTHPAQAEAETAAEAHVKANGGGEVFTHRAEGQFARIRKGEAQ